MDTARPALIVTIPDYPFPFRVTDVRRDVGIGPRSYHLGAIAECLRNGGSHRVSDPVTRMILADVVAERYGEQANPPKAYGTRRDHQDTNARRIAGATVTPA